MTKEDSQTGASRSALRGRRAWVILALMCGVYLAVALANVNRYGITTDELPDKLRGEFTELFFQESWQAGRPLQVGPLQKKYPRFERTDLAHPLFFPFLHHLGTKITQIVAPEGVLAKHVASHVPLVFTFVAGAAFVFLVGRRIFGTEAGLWAAGFVLLYPRLGAHGHFNPKDVPLMALATAAVFFLLRAQEKPSRGRLVAAAFVTACAINTKLEGLWLLLIGALALGLHGLEEASRDEAGTLQALRARAGSAVRPCAVFAVTCLVFCFLLWPSLWVDPLHVFKSAGRFASAFYHTPVLYLGTIYDSSQLPWHYAPVYLLAVTPVPLIAFWVAGLILMLRWARTQPRFAYGVLLVWFLIPIAVRTIPGVIRYNGIRHFFLVIPPLAILAGLAVAHLRRCVSASWPVLGHRAAAFGLPLLVGGWLLVENARVFPYSFGYVNSVTRSTVEDELHKVFFLDYWNSTYWQGVQWLNENARKDSYVCVPAFKLVVKQYEFRDDVQLGCGWGADYILLPAKTLSFCDFGPEGCRAFGTTYDLAHAEQAYGADLLRVYKRGGAPVPGAPLPWNGLDAAN